MNFRLIKNTRFRNRHALKGKAKLSSWKDVFGIDFDTYRKPIEFQMTPDVTWDNTEIDHVNLKYPYDVSEDQELKQTFKWKKFQPLLKEIHSQKGVKVYILDYQLQFIKTHLFLRLNDKGE